MASGSSLPPSVQMQIAGLKYGVKDEKGKSVTETLLRAHPEVNAIYAENDEMGLGALAAFSLASIVLRHWFTRRQRIREA